MKAFGEAVEGTTFGYDKKSSVCTIDFSNKLFYDTKYGIDLLFIDMFSAPVNPSWIYFDTASKYAVKNITLCRNDELTTEKELKAGDFVEFEAIAVNNTDDNTKTVQLVLAAYENGTMVAAGVTEDILAMQENPIYAYLTLPETGESFEIRAFLWSGDKSLTPLVNAIDFE